MQRAFSCLETLIIGHLGPVLKREILETRLRAAVALQPGGRDVVGRSNTPKSLSCDPLYRVLDCETSVKITFLCLIHDSSVRQNTAKVRPLKSIGRRSATAR